MYNDYIIFTLLASIVILLWRGIVLYRRKALEATVYIASEDGMFISDENGMILSINPAFETLTGYRADEVVNRPSSTISSEILSREFYHHFQEAVRLQQGWEGEISDCHKDGSIFFKLFTVKMIVDRAQTKKYIGSFLNMSKIEEANQKLWYQANFDALTDLPNRHMFFTHLQQQMERSDRFVQQLGVIYLDLNNFDEINYKIGHANGDSLIKLVVQRLEKVIRSNDLLYRIGGIEFVILLPNIDGGMENIAIAVLEALKAPFEIHSRTLSISSNMGLVLYPEDGSNANELLQKADEAVLASKREGKNRYARFVKSMESVRDKQ